MERDMRTSKILSLSLPPKLLREAQRLAKHEGRTTSELFREAFRRYALEARVRLLSQYGRRRARKLGITEADVPRLIEEYRRERRGQQP
jgi:hypothetical protein